MIECRNFPAGNGINFKTTVTEKDNNSVEIADFDFVLAGKTYPMTGGNFVIDVGDTIYMTPSGLKKYNADNRPIADDLFSNKSAYWIACRVDDNKLIVLEVA